jgi:hypothetical protein
MQHMAARTIDDRVRVLIFEKFAKLQGRYNRMTVQKYTYSIKKTNAEGQKHHLSAFVYVSFYSLFKDSAETRPVSPRVSGSASF